jgi:glyoxylate reductase
MSKKVYITRNIPEIGIKKLIDAGFEVDINKKPRSLTKKELIKILRKNPYDAVLTQLTDIVDVEVFEASPNTKIFANFAIGFNNFDIEEAKKRNIYLTNTPGGGADRVAEHTWALILALTCRVVEGDSFIRKGGFTGFDPMLLQGEHLEGKTLGLIGTGRIGADVARKAKAFGMNVIYYDIKRNEMLDNDHGALLSTIDGVLKNADVVSLHVPLSKETTHLINVERLARMKSSSYLINTSRGPVIDEQALFEALRNRVIRGAGLDVFEFEPKIVKGLEKLPNVVLTPHIASSSRDSRDFMSLRACENIIQALNGCKPTDNVYNI